MLAAEKFFYPYPDDAAVVARPVSEVGALDCFSLFSGIGRVRQVVLNAFFEVEISFFLGQDPHRWIVFLAESDRMFHVGKEKAGRVSSTLAKRWVCNSG